MCVCVCVCERERERETDRPTERERGKKEKESQTDRETERQRTRNPPRGSWLASGESKGFAAIGHPTMYIWFRVAGVRFTSGFGLKVSGLGLRV